MDREDQRKPARNADAKAEVEDSYTADMPDRAGKQPPTGTDDAEVTTMVCVTCGAERFFTDDMPADLVCEKCSGTVFRAFTTPLPDNDAASAAADEQARSMAYGDASPQSSPDEVRDLSR